MRLGRVVTSMRENAKRGVSEQGERSESAAIDTPLLNATNKCISLHPHIHHAAGAVGIADGVELEDVERF